MNNNLVKSIPLLEPLKLEKLEERGFLFEEELILSLDSITEFTFYYHFKIFMILTSTSNLGEIIQRLVN